MPSHARSRKSEKGAELVEFAFMMLPTFGLLFLIVNVAWVIFARACLQEAVREGVRYAITAPPVSNLDQSIQTVVQQHSFGVIPAANTGCVSVQFFSPSNLSSPLSGTGSDGAGNVVQISVANIAVRPLAPLLISPAALPLSAIASDIMQSSATGIPPGRGTAESSCPPSS